MPRQQTLFDTEPDPWDEDDQSEQLVASVVLLQGPHKEFDYLVPDEIRGRLEPGCRVKAPLGQKNRTVVGYCIRLESQKVGWRRLKPLRDP